MKNKKIYVSMLVLTVAFLIGMYVLKFFFPEEFMFAIQNENIVKVGKFIDSRQWLYTICCVITSTATYYLYICASSHRLRLKWYEVIILVAVSVAVRLTGLYVDEALRTAISLSSFLFLPALMGGDIKTSAITYTIHLFAQALSLGIRNLPMYFTNTPNFVITMLMTFECYLWLVLMYIIFNYKKEK